MHVDQPIANPNNSNCPNETVLIVEVQNTLAKELVAVVYKPQRSKVNPPLREYYGGTIPSFSLETDCSQF